MAVHEGLVHPLPSLLSPQFLDNTGKTDNISRTINDNLKLSFNLETYKVPSPSAPFHLFRHLIRILICVDHRHTLPHLPPLLDVIRPQRLFHMVTSTTVSFFFWVGTIAPLIQ